MGRAAESTRAGQPTVVRVAAISFVPVKFDLAGNADRLERAFRQAAAGGARLAVAPEGALEGYVVNEIIAGEVAAERIRDVAVPLDHPVIDRFRELARELELCLVFGFAERIDEDVYNSAVFIDNTGRICGKYHKMQLAEGYHHSWWFNRLGSQSRTFETPLGRCGILICNDRWNPALARIPALDGAQFLVIPSFGSRSKRQDEAVLGRGRENKLPVVEANVGVTLIVNNDEIAAVDRSEETVTFGEIHIAPRTPSQPDERDRVEQEFLKWRAKEMQIRYQKTLDKLESRDNQEQSDSKPADSADQPEPTQGSRWQNGPRLTAAAGHWAFRPIRKPPLPGNATGTAREPIDVFVQAEATRHGLTPARPADRRTFIRRLSFDLIGLPPTPAEVAAFIADTRPDAYERLVDRLLTSPHYGERWARRWLDLCHYADSDGYLTDQLRPVAWRYRAWLVDALNADLPFDAFTVQQLAGDLLPDASTAERMATGFLRQTLSNREGGADPEEFRVEQVVDRTQMVGEIWLGLSVGCARCHDHKYDPLSQREFYQLFAFFDNAAEINMDAPLAEEARAYYAALPAYRAKRRETVAPYREAIAELQSRWEQQLLAARDNPGRDFLWDRQWELLGLVWGGELGEGQLEGREIAMLTVDARTELQQDRLLDYFLKSGEVIDPPRFKELKLGELSAALEKLRAELPPVTRAATMHAAPNRRDTYVHVRGDFRSPGEVVTADVPQVLRFADLPVGRSPRLAFAQWLVHESHPLTARVTMNRMWHDFFGHGIVETLGDFGMSGARPAQPELLDWLARDLVHQDWSVKRMHRRIVTSATYRQASAVRSPKDPDPANRWLARQLSLRLSAEQIRDAALRVSGLIELRVGGPAVRPPQPESVTQEGFDNGWVLSTGGDRYRRGLYTFVQRTSPFAQHTLFDAASPNQICTRRERSNTPLQALLLLNDPVFFEAAQALAARILNEAGSTTHERLAFLYEVTLARLPSRLELQTMVDYLAVQREILANDPAAIPPIAGKTTTAIESGELALWTMASSVMLNLHEFITRN